MSSNKHVREQLERLFGKECFIDKLQLRKDKNRHYTSKAQMKRMKQLTYHHIKPKSEGGKATIENGALLSTENHEWFHQQEKSKQAEMNRAFQNYKVGIAIFANGKTEQSQVIDLKDTEDFIEIPLIKETNKQRRAREKRETRKALEEYEKEV